MKAQDPSAIRNFPATSMPDRDWWSALWPQPADVLRKIGITPAMTVLDLCCGDGYFTSALAALVNSKVHALDIDPEMIAAAQEEVRRNGGSVRQWLCGDARDIGQLLSGRVDYVLMANTFHGVPDQPALAGAVHDVLRPGGRFGIVNWHPLPREETKLFDKPRGPKTAMRMAPATVRHVVEPAGFRLHETVELPPWHYGIVFVRGR